MKSQKRLLASTVRLVSLGGTATLLLHIGFQYPMYFVEDAIASVQNTSNLIIQDKEDSNTSTTNSGGGTGSHRFGAARARVGDPPPPSDGQQTSGGARGSCFTDPPLAALSPRENFGITISPQPTFWFYIPEIPEERRGEIIGHFGLLNRDGVPIFDAIALTLPNQSGYVGLGVPEDIALKVGNDYQWYFEFNCEESEPATAVYGWIRRIALDAELLAQIALSDQDAYNIYVNNLIWFDVIDYFTRRRLEEPMNDHLRQTWIELLSAEGIDLEEELPSDPILFEYSPDQ